MTVGKGNSYGTEWMIKKKFANTEGWIGYTLSWANREYPELNLGEPFPYKFDRRHQINLAINHNINDKIFLSCNWVFMSGFNTTVPYAKYYKPTGTYGGEIYLYTSKNAFKTRPYHRMDVSVRFYKKKKWGERNWVLSLYNAYSRKNTFYVTAREEIDDLEGDDEIAHHSYKIVESTYFPIIPSVSYEFNF